MRSTLIIVLLAISVLVEAQPVIDFNRKTFDFGTFPESEGSVAHTFKFTNTGDAPLVILNVKTSCGCTVPEYTADPIPPERSGTIKITYSASGRPGKFSNSITVITNSIIPEITLNIKGDVMPIEKSEEDEYAYNINGVKLKSLHIPIGDIYAQEEKSYSFTVKNSSDSPRTITFSSLPTYITIKATPTTVQAKDSGEVKVIYNTKKLKDWAYQNEEFLINVAEKGGKPKAKKLFLFANIQENFTNMTPEQITVAPKIKVSSRHLSFGEINGIESTEKNSEIENGGESTLYIRKIFSLSKVITVKAAKERIKKGEKIPITVTILPEKSRGKIVNEQITIITNDPKKPVACMQVTATFK